MSIWWYLGTSKGQVRDIQGVSGRIQRVSGGIWQGWPRETIIQMHKLIVENCTWMVGRAGLELDGRKSWFSRTGLEKSPAVVEVNAL